MCIKYQSYVNHDGLRQKVISKKCAPRWRTLSHHGLRPGMVQNVPLVGGLCHVTDFDQVWSKNVPLVGGLCHITDFDQVWSKNVPLFGGLCHIPDFDQVWSKNVPLVGGLCHVPGF